MSNPPSPREEYQAAGTGAETPYIPGPYKPSQTWGSWFGHGVPHSINLPYVADRLRLSEHQVQALCVHIQYALLSRLPTSEHPDSLPGIKDQDHKTKIIDSAVNIVLPAWKNAFNFPDAACEAAQVTNRKRKRYGEVYGLFRKLVMLEGYSQRRAGVAARADDEDLWNDESSDAQLSVEGTDPMDMEASSLDEEDGSDGDSSDEPSPLPPALPATLMEDGGLLRYTQRNSVTLDQVATYLKQLSPRHLRVVSQKALDTTSSLAASRLLPLDQICFAVVKEDTWDGAPPLPASERTATQAWLKIRFPNEVPDASVSLTQSFLEWISERLGFQPQEHTLQFRSGVLRKGNTMTDWSQLYGALLDHRDNGLSTVVMQMRGRTLAQNELSGGDMDHSAFLN